LAGKHPEKLKELQDLFLKEAVKYSVLPLDDRLLERLNAALVGRPDPMAGWTSLTVFEGMTGMSENILGFFAGPPKRYISAIRLQNCYENHSGSI
jgi:hypothetical protein